MELYRRSSAFDRLLALYRSILCSDAHRRQILELVDRSIKIGGGMTLITRIGIENWFAIERADGKDLDIVKELANQLHGCVDQAAAEQWKAPLAVCVDIL